MARVIKDPFEFRHLMFEEHLSKKTIGFVPTMGALHEGHISLFQKARRENDILSVSVFVNPTQFDDPNDLRAYPQPFAEDMKILEECGVDYIFHPDPNLMYPDEYNYQVIEKDLSKQFCGIGRKGHFEGMLTVVLKLLNLAQAHKAYFGIKDFQQVRLIEGMVNAFFLRTQIITCETKRLPNGLALSSRNSRLSAEDQKKASLFFQILREASSDHGASVWLEKEGFEVEYVETHQKRRLGAVRLSGVRLIDNVEV